MGMTTSSLNGEATVKSTSDDRVANNVMRHEYRVLSDEEKQLMKDVKDMGADFFEKCSQVPDGDCMRIARQKIEEAVMWAVKGITK